MNLFSRCTLAAFTLALAFADDQKPVIISALPDASVNPTQITITGNHLGNGKPLVTLDSFRLMVVTFTSISVTTLLPVGLKPGSYLLTSSPTAKTTKIRPRPLTSPSEPPDRKAIRAIPESPAHPGSSAHLALKDLPDRKDLREQPVRAMFTPSQRPACLFAFCPSR